MEQRSNRGPLASPVFKKPEIIAATKKQKIRRTLNLKPLKYAAYLIVTGVIVYEIFFSPLFKIKNIEISGIKSVEISDYVNISLKGRNILFLMTGRYLRELSQKFPILQEARIIRGLPSTVKLIASERKQVLVWCANICVEIDSHGFAYQQVPRPTDKVVLDDKTGTPLKIADRIVSTQFIEFYLGALEQLDAIGVKIASAHMDETTFKINLKTADGWEIILDSSESLKNQISAVKQTLDTNRADIHEYIDVRVHGTVYIK